MDVLHSIHIKEDISTEEEKEEDTSNKGEERMEVKGENEDIFLWNMLN